MAEHEYGPGPSSDGPRQSSRSRGRATPPLAVRASLEPEALGIGNGNKKARAERLRVAVFGQEQDVEARVRRGQAGRVAPIPRDGEPRVERPEAVDGDAVRAGDEEEQALLLLAAQGAGHPPEVLHRGVVLREPVLVQRVGLQRAEVERLRAADELLQLLRAEQLQRRAVAQALEPLRERRELPVDAVLQEPPRVQLDVLVAVGVGHGRVLPARHEVHVLDAPPEPRVVLHPEREVERCLHVAAELEDLAQGLVDHRVDGLEIVEGGGVPHELLVHQGRERQLQDVVVVDGQAEDDADQLVLHLQVQVARLEPVQPRVLVEHEHPEVGVEDVPQQQVEELLLQAALVNALLPHEVHLEGLLQPVGAAVSLRVDVPQRVGDEHGPPPDLEQHVRAGGPREHQLQHGVLELVELLAHVLVPQDPGLAGRVIQEGELAEAEPFGAPPLLVVLLEVEVLAVRGHIVEVLVRQDAGLHVGLVQQVEEEGGGLHALVHV
mmetsp:Transcript_27306/g.76234  ORF Transcript_27306/g.76234 Transcript_27306/m.76234 type:complete len:493 (+) Transcript_27306:61-1539(+)